ncbi:MAG TPA: hypothetical protein VEB18_03345 [Candidatus Paceibacterota bacterium]|nr:hypothetical protein [Candidatus Paceibacterota bacterium]
MSSTLFVFAPFIAVTIVFILAKKASPLGAMVLGAAGVLVGGALGSYGWMQLGYSETHAYALGYLTTFAYAFILAILRRRYNL